MATQVVEHAYRVWNEKGPRAFAELAAEDLEVHDPPELPDGQVWRGRDAVVAHFEDVVEATGGRWADIDEVRTVGDEVLVSLTWRLERDNPATLASVYHLVRVEGGRIVRIRVFLDKEAAT